MPAFPNMLQRTMKVHDIVHHTSTCAFPDAVKKTASEHNRSSVWLEAGKHMPSAKQHLRVTCVHCDGLYQKFKTMPAKQSEELRRSTSAGRSGFKRSRHTKRKATAASNTVPLWCHNLFKKFKTLPCTTMDEQMDARSSTSVEQLHPVPSTAKSDHPGPPVAFSSCGVPRWSGVFGQRGYCCAEPASSANSSCETKAW